MKNLATTLAKRRTTLDLPPDLLERTDEAVRLGAARSRNNLIAAALEDYLNALDRIASIDARFAEMERDTRYREMHLSLAAGFAESDAEALAADFSESSAEALAADFSESSAEAPGATVTANGSKAAPDGAAEDEAAALALEKAGP